MVKVEDLTESKQNIEKVRGLVRKIFEGFKIKEDDEQIKVLRKRKPVFAVLFSTHAVFVTDPHYEEEARKIADEYERIINKEPTLYIDYSLYRHSA